MTSFCLKIADITFLIESDDPLRGFAEAYRDFLSEEDTGEVTLRFRPGRIPDLEPKSPEQSFTIGAWNLYLSDGRWILSLIPEESEASALAAFEQDFSAGDIYYDHTQAQAESISQVLSHPIHQILMVSILSRGRGCMFHAAGIDDEGDGYLFLGRSSEGKSTLAGLWKEGRVLDDDRIIVREREGRFWMYGTPWHSIPRPSVLSHTVQASASGLPVKSLFALRQGERNVASRKTRAEALPMILKRCFLPFWVREGSEYVIDLCVRMAKGLPCYELTFRRDESVVDYVKGLTDSMSWTSR